MKKHFLTVLCGILSISFLLSGCASGRTVTTAALPADTAVVVRFNTDSGKMPRSWFYYYDSAGSQLQKKNIDEEMVGNCMEFADGKLGIFLRNETVVQSPDNAVSFSEYDERSAIMGKRYGIAQCGYLPEFHTFYALRDVGQVFSDKVYYFTLRFVSQEQSYDIVLPYDTESIFYDEEARIFYCLLGKLYLDPDKTWFDYVRVIYSEESGRFELEKSVHHLDNEEMSAYRLRYSSGIQSSEDTLWHYFITPDVPEQPEGSGKIWYSRYDLKNASLVENVCIREIPALGVYRGSTADLSPYNEPLRVSDGMSLMFLENEEILQLSGKSQESREFSFPFSGIRNPAQPKKNLNSGSADFSDTLFHIRADGAFDVFVVTEDKMMQIHRMKPDGSVELLWEAKLPGDIGSLAIGDFAVKE